MVIIVENSLSGKIYGYVRVSTIEQNLDRQIQKIKQLGISDKNIFQEKASGKTMNRPIYTKMKRRLQHGDTLYIDSISRLGRSWMDVIKEYNDIVHVIGADIISLSESESFISSKRFREMGDFGSLVEQTILNTMSFCADIQRKQMLEAQAEGIAVAKQKGVQFGRRPLSNEEIKKIKDIHSTGHFSIRAIANMTHHSPGTVFKYVKMDFATKKPVDSTVILESGH